MKIKIPATKKRRVPQHQLLWDSDLPFNHKVERPKVCYRRRPKHRRNIYESGE